MRSALLFLFAHLLAGGQERISITGTVVDGRSDAPLAGVRVAISRMDVREIDLAVVTTGADGRFSFSMPPSDYSLSAHRAGPCDRHTARSNTAASASG